MRQEETGQLLEALAQAFLALAAAGPHLVILEDVHWMDAASIEALRYLLPRLAAVPLLIVISVRREELAGHTADLLAAMERTRLPRCLSLGRLDEAATVELVQRALDLPQPAPRFSARLYAETEGNPFFLVETLLALVQAGVLARDEGGVWAPPGMNPPSTTPSCLCRPCGAEHRAAPGAPAAGPARAALPGSRDRAGGGFPALAGRCRLRRERAPGGW